MRIKVRNGFLLTLVMLLLANPAWALQSDNKKPMHIASDSVSFNRKTGVGVYTGNVKVVQGTTHLRCDKLITKSGTDNHLREVVATGKRAHYWSEPGPGKPLLNAWAQTIKYFAVNKHVVLIGDALVTQDKNQFSGPKIQYDVSKQLVIAPRSKQGRSHIVLLPQELQGADSQSASTASKKDAS